MRSVGDRFYEALIFTVTLIPVMQNSVGLFCLPGYTIDESVVGLDFH